MVCFNCTDSRNKLIIVKRYHFLCYKGAPTKSRASNRPQRLAWLDVAQAFFLGKEGCALSEDEATYSFVIGLLLLKLLHHNAPFFVLAPLVLKPNPNDPRAEASHFYQLLFHEGVRSGVGSIAGPQGVKLFFIKDSPDSGCLLGLLVDVGSQSWLSGRDRFCCKGRGK